MKTLLTLKETSQMLNVHPNTLRLWDRKGILKTVRFGIYKNRKCKKGDVFGLIDQNH